MTHPDHPAFPTENTPGLTKREYFAAIAMQGYIASHTGDSYAKPEHAAERALEHADALTAALNKRPETDPDQL